MNITICDKCGGEISLSCFPFCPHEPTQFAIKRDEIPGGQWFFNGFDEPRQFFSHSAHEQALAAEGMMIKAYHKGPLDKHCSNWAAGIDAGTLENARTLVSRGSRATKEPESTWDGVIEKRDAGTFRFTVEHD